MPEEFKKPILDNDKKNYLIELALKQLIASLIKKYSFVSIGPVKALIAFFGKRVLKILLEETILRINLFIIDYVVNSDYQYLQDLRDDFVNLKDNPTDEELNEIDRNLESAARDLIQFGRRKL